MIKMSSSIPEVINTDEQSLRETLTAIKLFAEELQRKAQSIQEGYVAVAPATTDFESDNSAILYDDGVNRRAYYLLNGALRYAILT